MRLGFLQSTYIRTPHERAEGELCPCSRTTNSVHAGGPRYLVLLSKLTSVIIVGHTFVSLPVGERRPNVELNAT